MDDEEKAMMNYKPPLSHMKTAMWALWFVFLTLIILWNQTETNFDPWFAWGGWFTAGGFALFALTPLIVSRDSPKIVSVKIGTSIASPQPILTIPEQPGHPAYGVWPAGSVKSWFVYEFAQSTRGYVIAPLDLAYVMGEEGRGLNVVINCHVEGYTDHTQLPPHILESLKSMRKPMYDNKMPIYYNWWPALINELDEKDYNDLIRDFKYLGVTEDKIQDARRILETAACKLSKFRYGEQFASMEKNLLRREKIVNSENADLKKSIQYLKVENEDLYKRITGTKDHEQPKSLLSIPSARRDREESEDENRGDRY